MYATPLPQFSAVAILKVSTGIHTGGKEGEFPPPPPPFRKFPPPPLSKIPPPPLLNQHKYYNMVVLKHKQQHSDKCCSKKGMHLFKDTYNFSKGVLNIGNRHCFQGWGGGGGGGSDGSPPPPFRKILYETKGVSTRRRRGEGMQLPYSQYRGRNAGGY